MATDRNVFCLIDEQEYLGQQCLNVYFYQQAPAITAGSADLIDRFQALVLPEIRATQVANVVHNKISAYNIFDPTEYAEDLISLAGNGASIGDPMPSFVAVDYTLARETPLTRSGRKRITGQGESWQASGVLSGGSAIAAVSALAAKLAIVLTDPTLLIQWFFPVLVKRILDGGTYRLPATMGEADINGIEGAVYDLNLTTQNSRKIGVGA